MKVTLLIAAILLLVSCKQKDTTADNLNNYTNTVLTISSQLAEENVMVNMYRLESKLSKDETMDTAAVYKPIADSIIAFGKNMTYYLDSLLTNIKQGDKLEDKDSLFEKLKAYEAKVKGIDVRISNEFGESLFYIDTLKGYNGSDRKTFYDAFLNGATKEQSITFLNSLKCNVLNTEAVMLDYINKQCSAIVEGWAKYSAILSQNFEHLKPNHTLVITAGIGEFKRRDKGVFTIEGKKISISDFPDNVVIYKIKAAQEPGKHSVPVKISWIKPNGETVVLEKELVYYVD